MKLIKLQKVPKESIHLEVAVPENCLPLHEYNLEDES
jgi:hypothetical protein